MSQNKIWLFSSYCKILLVSTSLIYFLKSCIVDTNKLTIAGPIIIPQNPKVPSPATIAKKMINEFIFVGVFTIFLFIFAFLKIDSFYNIIQ